MLGYALMLVTADGLTSVTQPQLTVDLVCYADKGPPVDSKACRHDADVQVCRATANAGARSAACSPTTAYWSALSDRWGRVSSQSASWAGSSTRPLRGVTWPRLTAAGL